MRADDKLPLIGTAAIGIVVIVIGVILTSGGWTIAMAVPLLILIGGLAWSFSAVGPKVSDDVSAQRVDVDGRMTGASSPATSAPVSSVTDRGSFDPHGSVDTAAIRSTQSDRMSPGSNGDAMTVDVMTVGGPVQGADTSSVDRDGPARIFEFLPSELSGDPQRLQCPRCGRFEGVVVDDDRGSIACDSCNAVFARSPNAVSFVRMFDLGMFVVSDPLSVVAPGAPQSTGGRGPSAATTEDSAAIRQQYDSGTA